MPLLEQVLEKNPESVKIVYKNFPLGSHKFARKAAAAAMVAHSQGKFWKLYDALFKNYSKLNDQKIKEIAFAVGLDQPDLDQRLNDPEIAGQIEQDIQDGLRAGVRGSPTIFINGRRLKNRSLQGFQTLIDKELRRLGKKPPQPSS